MTDGTDRPRRERRRDEAGEEPPAAPVRPDAGHDEQATQAFRWDAAPAGHVEQATQAFRWDVDPGEGHEPTDPRRNPWAPGAAGADTEPAPVDPSLAGAPPMDAEPPTEAMAWETAVVPEVAPGSPVPRSAAPGAGAGTDADGGSGPGGIDLLFQPGHFRDFEPTATLPARPAGASPVRPGRTRPSLTSTQRGLLWAAGVLVAILVLLALFAIGRRLPAMFAAPQPVETATQTPTPTPEPVDPAAGPVAPGEYAWDELRGGECLDPYESSWQEDYTVVGCADPHAAQLLIRAAFPEDMTGEAYPGFDELAGQINLLCTDPAVIDYGAAAEYDDIVVEGAHAVTPEEWAAGHREYFCFLTRSGGEPLSGSLAAGE